MVTLGFQKLTTTAETGEGTHLAKATGIQGAWWIEPRGARRGVSGVVPAPRLTHGLFLDLAVLLGHRLRVLPRHPQQVPRLLLLPDAPVQREGQHVHPLADPLTRQGVLPLDHHHVRAVLADLERHVDHQVLRGSERRTGGDVPRCAGIARDERGPRAVP